MNLSTQPYKGARDYYPEDKRLQQWIFSKWREVAEAYGYEQYDAPILESTEIYAAKTSDEIVNEQTYSFTDRGGREVTIRTEMTPSVSRMVAAKRQELSYPLRWYSIPNLWRYERPQRGRNREFWQLNIDLFGVEGVTGDFEMLQIASDILKAVGAKPSMYVIKVNSRKLVDELLTKYLGLNETQAQTLVRLIDRMQKMERSEFTAKVEAVLTPTQREDGVGDKLMQLLQATSLKAVTAQLAGSVAAAELEQLLALCDQAGLGNVGFDITLMRGFDYYTDIVFEVFDTNPENNRSMFGGGRYDGLVSQFGVEPIPTVGFGMGDATLENFLSVHGLLPSLPPETDLYVILIGDVFAQASPIIQDLRGMGVNVAVDSTGRKLDKQIKTADKKGVRYVLFMGEAELASGQYKLKDLQSGQEGSHSLERLVSMVKDYRK